MEDFKVHVELRMVTPNVVMMKTTFNKEISFNYYDLVNWERVDNDDSNSELSKEDIENAEYVNMSNSSISYLVNNHLKVFCNHETVSDEVRSSINSKINNGG